MKIKVKLISLTLIGTRKNYNVFFKDGFNMISGHTSTGKTSILEMIDYALGAKGHKSYIEIGASCSHVELILLLGDERFKIRRQLFDFKADALVEIWNEEKLRFLFYNHYAIDIPKNPRSLSAFLIEKLGLQDITISGQKLSFRDIFKYCYLKQTEIDNEDILSEKTWEKDIKRRATFEIIFNLYDKTLEDFKLSLDEKINEAKELAIRLSGVQDFLKSVEIASLQECSVIEKGLREEINSLQIQLAQIKKSDVTDSPETIGLRQKIMRLKNELDNLAQKEYDQKQYIQKLQLLYNQYMSEIDKKELAVQGYLSFNQYEFLFCPNCLRPLSRQTNGDVCCLCGSEKSDDTGELFIIKKDIATLKRKSSELLKFTDLEEKKYDSLLSKISICKKSLSEAEIELQQLSRDYINPNMEQIEFLNYEIGRKNRRILELDKEMKMFEEVERYQQIIKDKDISIQNLRKNIKTLTEDVVDKEDLLRRLSREYEEILEKIEYPKLSSAYIDNKKYLPYVRDRKYDNIGSLAGVTLITIAYYMAILVIGSSPDFHHPNLLLIDSPRKNLGAQAAKNEEDEFKDEKIFHATISYLYSIAEAKKDDIQLIVVNNGYPDFLPNDCIVAEFDSDGHRGLPKGLIDDATD